jgi:hypothetical protein
MNATQTKAKASEASPRVLREHHEISARQLCKLAGLTYVSSKIEDDGSITICFDSPPRPKPWQSDDDEDSGF